MTLTSPAIRQLPADCFYWARLNVEALPRARRRDHRTLGFLFESVLPVPIDEVQAAFGYSRNGSAVIACALDKGVLNREIQETPGAVVLSPAACPTWLDTYQDQVDLEVLNVLHGAYEPKSIRAARSRSFVASLVVAAVCIGLMCIGMIRRTVAIEDHRAALYRWRDEVIESVVPAAPGSNQPSELRMLSELRTLRQTRGDDAALKGALSAGSQSSVVEVFAMLLKNWPRDLHIRTESLLITPVSMTARAIASSTADVQFMVEALTGLSTPDGGNGAGTSVIGAPIASGNGAWVLQQPQINVLNPEEVSATLQWRFELASNTSAQESRGEAR